MGKTLFTVFALFLISAFVVRSEEEVDEKDVVVLTDDNFDETIKSTEFILVEFYAPWCGHCKRLTPEYAKAATTLKSEGASVVLAKLDATIHTKTAGAQAVRGYPTIKFFRSGNSVDYEGGRSAEEIVTWLKKKTGPVSTLLKTKEELDNFIGQAGTKFVAYLAGAEESDAAYSAWIQAGKSGKLEDFVLAHVTDASLVGDKKVPSFSVYKVGEEPASFTGDFVADEIATFGQAEGFPLLNELAQPVWQRCSTSGTPLLALFLSAQTEEELAKWRPAALKLKGKVAFSYSTQSSLADRWGSSGKVIPTAILAKFVDSAPKFVVFNEEAETLSVETLGAFVEKALAGEYVAYKKSEPIPETNDGPVKVLVAKNYDSIVNDKTKDVFVEFYAPWCGHCKKLAPIWEELGEEFEDSETVVIAKLDGTANALPDNVNVQGYPTLIFFPADNKAGIPYNGDREFPALKKFVEEHASTKVDKKDEL